MSTQHIAFTCFGLALALYILAGFTHTHALGVASYLLCLLGMWFGTFGSKQA